MPKEQYLKRRNTPKVFIFIIWCLAVYLTFLSSPSGFWGKLVPTFRECRADAGIIVILLPIMALILTGLISSGNKARLIYWRWRNASPGHRVFSELVTRDPRIDLEKLSRKMGSLPQEPRQQNTKWYALYKQYAESVTVKEAHRNFLLARDLCSISFLFGFFGPWGLLLFQHTWKWISIYILTMFLHYIVLALVAQNHGNRFVCNVIAEYTSDDTRIYGVRD